MIFFTAESKIIYNHIEFNAYIARLEIINCDQNIYEDLSVHSAVYIPI